MLLKLAITGGVVYAGLKAYFRKQDKPRLMDVLQANNHPKEESVNDVADFPSAPDLDEIDKVVTRDLLYSTALVGLTTVGALVNPIFSLLSIPGLIYLQIPYLKAGYHELAKERRIGLGVLDSTITIVFIFGRLYFFTATFLLLMNASQKLILKTQDKSRQQLVNILGELPKQVWVCIDGVELQIPFEKLKTGDVVIVHAGEMIPIDGLVLSGMGSVDQQRLTGEAKLVEKERGDEVFASTILLSGSLQVEVNKAGEETVAAKIGKILNQTVDFKSQLQTQGEMIADRSALPTLLLGAITLPILGPISGITVLLSGIGYNMRIFAPISVLNFLKIAVDGNILVKDGRALEGLAEVDTVVFDKTGTLTLDKPYVDTVHSCSTYTDSEVLQYAASAECKQSHPIALAILEKAQSAELSLLPLEDAAYEVGYGLKVKIDGKLIRVGSRRFMERELIIIPTAVEAVQQQCDLYGHTLVYVALDDALIGTIELHATIRPSAYQTIEELHQRGLTTYIISGDNEKPTQQLAQTVGISNYYAEVLPEDKANLIQELQSKGRKVCFIGDGINDAIALRQADVSISLRGATTIATDTAQVILLEQNLNHLVQLFELADKLHKNLATNLWLTVVPGVICIGGVYMLHFGIIASFVLFYSGLTVGIMNSMLPMWQHKRLADKGNQND